VNTQSPVERGLAFLRDARSPDGWWQDFELLAGYSDEWVSAYVASLLLNYHSPASVELALQTMLQLDNRRAASAEGWGFNALTPPDSDSTAWALFLGARLRLEPSGRHLAALAWLKKQANPDGGLPTYGDPDEVRRFMGIDPGMDFQGWSQSHTTVSAITAAVIPSMSAGVQRYLEGVQQDDGGWGCYWWVDRCQPTTLALMATDTRLDMQRREAASLWLQEKARKILQTQDSEPVNCFSAAWCVLGLGLFESSECQSYRDEIIGLLLANQSAAGGWDGSARLRVPYPRQRKVRMMYWSGIPVSVALALK